jgi:hypothetical protein
MICQWELSVVFQMQFTHTCGCKAVDFLNYFGCESAKFQVKDLEKEEML